MSKIGEGHFEGMARKGLTELGQYLPAFNQAGTNVIEDQGVWPNKTPGEIAEVREGPGHGKEQEGATLEDLKSYAAEKTKEAEQQMEQRGPGKDQDLEM